MRNFRSLFMSKIRYILVFVFVLAFAGVSMAQTPVPIVVDTNAIFTQTNNWITVFAPIIAIGAGISIALAILTFIASQIIAAFKGRGAR